jgi:hypothetical protein
MTLLLTIKLAENVAEELSYLIQIVLKSALKALELIESLGHVWSLLFSDGIGCTPQETLARINAI